MKNFAFLFAFFIVFPAYAYQAGQTNRTNFGATQPQATPSNNYRAFSNYNNRSWSQGVQTQTVQTEVAGTSVVDFDKNTPQKLVTKTQAAPQPPAAKTGQPQPNATSAANPAQAPANMDPAAMMQQVQGMMNAMGNMTGSTQPAPSGQQVATQMPAGMPDISALMGGAMPAAPAVPAAPVKK